MEHLDLHLLRHGGGKALDVQFLGVQTHGLHEQLVAELIREADDLRLKTGAVPGADALDQAGVHGGPVQIFLDDALRLLGGPGEPAYRLVIGRVLRGIGEGHRNLVPRLDLHLVKVHRPGVDPGGRTGLEPPQGQVQLQQRVRQRTGGVHPVRAGILHTGADDGAALEIGAGGQNGGLHIVHRAGGKDHLADGAAVRPNLHHLALTHCQVGLAFQGALHPLLVLPAVRLGPEGPDGRAFPEVQQPVLDAAFVGGFGHFAPQGVQLPDQVALAGAADGGVAGHVAHSVQIDGKDDGLQPQAGGGQSRLDAGMSGADDGNIKLSRRKGFHTFILSFSG